MESALGEAVLRRRRAYDTPWYLSADGSVPGGISSPQKELWRLMTSVWNSIDSMRRAKTYMRARVTLLSSDGYTMEFQAGKAESLKMNAMRNIHKVLFGGRRYVKGVNTYMPGVVQNWYLNRPSGKFKDTTDGVTMVSWGSKKSKSARTGPSKP